jgi:hypothetical protein
MVEHVHDEENNQGESHKKKHIELTDTTLKGFVSLSYSYYFFKNDFSLLLFDLCDLLQKLTPR